MPRTKQQLEIENILLLAKEAGSLRAIRKAEDKLSDFIRLAWPVIEPGTEFVPGRHIDAIAEHLEACRKRQIRKLIINLPPRHFKSGLMAVLFPAWVWITQPQEKFLFTSYDLKLSYRDSRRCRMLIKSPWYQRHWSDRFQIVKDQDEKRRFDNNKMGYRVSTSTDAGTTGEGADIICLEGSVKLMTDHGEISVCDIVEKRLPVRVLGSSGKFQEILRYDKNPGRQLLEFEFSDGSRLRCTEDHPLFVESMGYVAARDMLSCEYGSLQLRRLPDSIRQASEACGPVKTWNLLLSRLLREVLQRRKKSGLRFFEAVDSLLGLRQDLRYAEAGCGEALALRFLHSASKEGDVASMRDLCDHFQNPIQDAEVLLSGLRGKGPLRERECPLQAWEQNQIFDGLQRSLKAEDLRAGQLALCNMFSGEASWFEAARDSSRRWLKEQPQSQQPDFALQAVPSEDSSEEWAEPRIDEPVGIVNIRSLPAPHFVYNLNVAPDHDYYANGILTHNCLDDPNNIKEMTSQAYIESIFEYHDQVLATRLNDPRTGVRILIQQRCSEQDLTGHVLERETGWDHLVLPCEYEGPSKVTSINWKDWRTEPGELLWPERFPRNEIEDIKRTLGPMGVAGQLQQRPAPAEGSTYLREWWNYYNESGTSNDNEIKIETAAGKYIEKKPESIPLAFEQIIWGVDCAFKNSKDSDLTAIHVWGRVGSKVYLLHRRTGRWDFPQMQRQMREVAVDYNCPEKMIEDKANGPAIIQSLKNEIPGLIESPIDGGLKALANSLTGYAEAGNIYLPNPDLFPWVRELIEQYAVFPNGKHDDDVAAASHALRRLFDSASNSGVPEFRVVPRVGEPDSASHVRPDAEIANELEPQWRRWIAIAPGKIGAAIWVCETPSRALRVYREFEMNGVDAHEAGRKIAELSMPDVTAFMNLMNDKAKWSIDFLMEKDAFRPVEPVGSFAELLEDGILSYESSSENWMERQEMKLRKKLAKFSSDMVQIEDGSIERLRDLLRFFPPDFKRVPYDRKKAIQLADKDVNEYQRYISAVEGTVFGEWPKIKIAASCKGVIRALGGFRRNEDIADNFMRALLIGVSAPDSLLMRIEEPKERPYPFVVPQPGRARGNRRFGRVA